MIVQLGVSWPIGMLLTVVVTALMVGREVRKQRKYPAKIVMSVEEIAVNDDVIPYTNNQFVGYVTNTVFTDLEEAEWEVFKLRWKALGGGELDID